jgi:hypothetical protein
MSLTASYLIDRFEYRDGMLFYKKTVGMMKGGSKVGTMNNGYIRTLINRKGHLVHRIIFMMHHGFLPEFLDHIDGNRTNNLIDNLRPATSSQNGLNRGKLRSNTSGYTGVTWVASYGKYSARISIDEKRFFIGYFDDPCKAHEAYCKFAKSTKSQYVRMI